MNKKEFINLAIVSLSAFILITGLFVYVELDKKNNYKEKYGSEKAYQKDYTEDDLEDGVILKSLGEEVGVSLTAKEVQYDIYNNLDKKFYISGTIELSDYYNYGYTNSKDLFSTLIIPHGGSYSDGWYIYFDRKTGSNLYEQLLLGSVEIEVIAMAKSQAYKNGQGKMARAYVIRMLNY